MKLNKLNYFFTLIIISILLSSCNNILTPNNNTTFNNENSVEVDTGSAQLKMFVPDYYFLANNNQRIIAPQTTKIRLSHKLTTNMPTGETYTNWKEITTVELSSATKTPVENAPDHFPGAMYTITFKGLVVGTYGIGDLKVELLDSTNNIVSSGTNNSQVVITKGSKASTTFYTMPKYTSAGIGSLDNGEMKFIPIATVAGVDYSFTVSSSTDFPDIVLFSNDGKLLKYFPIDQISQSTINFKSSYTGIGYLGVWADDGKNIPEYNMTFNSGKGTILKDAVLSGNDLKWTKANSPYYINQNTLIDDKSELSIEPGVQVIFTGPYYLKITGSVKAIGSETNPIVFMKSIDNMDTWSGIKLNSSKYLNTDNEYNYISGNIFANCNFICASTPLSLETAAYVRNCTFSNNSYAPIVGENRSVLVRNTFKEGVSDDNNYGSYRSYFLNNNIYKTFSPKGTIINNNFIDVSVITDSCTYRYNTFNSCDISIEDTDFQLNKFFSCSFNTNYGYSSNNYSFTNNNFINCNSPIFTTNEKYSSNSEINLQNNYWGDTNTKELSNLGSSLNVSFLHDYYDNFELKRFDYSNWFSNPIEDCGYSGDAFIDFDFNVDSKHNDYDYGYEIKDSTLSINYTSRYHANELKFIRIAQSKEDLTNAPWIPYQNIILFNVDNSKIKNGYLYLYSQLKDSVGTISYVHTTSDAYNTPPKLTVNLDNNKVFTDSDINYNLIVTPEDNGRLSNCKIYINNELFYERNFEDYYTGSFEFAIPLQYFPQENYELRIILKDKIGNETINIKNFTIQRSVDTTYKGITYNDSTGEFIKDNSTIYLWHFNNNGNEETDVNSTFNSYYNAMGALGNGYASSAAHQTFDLNLDKSITIEYWTYGDNYQAYIDKENALNYRCNSSIYSKNLYYQMYYSNPDNSIAYIYKTIDTDNFNPTSWHYWAFTTDGTSICLYIDGKLTYHRKIDKPIFNQSNSKLSISLTNIDELRISKKLRTPDEIAEYYNNSYALISKVQ